MEPFTIDLGEVVPVEFESEHPNVISRPVAPITTGQCHRPIGIRLRRGAIRVELIDGQGRITIPGDDVVGEVVKRVLVLVGFKEKPVFDAPDGCPVTLNADAKPDGHVRSREVDFDLFG